MRVHIIFSLIIALHVCTPAIAADMGIDEKHGGYVPLDLSFFNEQGEKVSLRQVVDKPTVLALVYFECPGICTPLLSGLAETLNKLELEPARDYSALAVSFDENDSFVTAAGKKRNYLNLIDKPFPEDGWRFLTGDTENINRITEAVGFRFKREGDILLHQAAIMVISKDGKICRYLYGTAFLPFDLQMAITEASAGRTGPTVNRVLLYCFKYDAEGKRYVLNITKISAIVFLMLAAGFYLFLRRSTKAKI